MNDKKTKKKKPAKKKSARPRKRPENPGRKAAAAADESYRELFDNTNDAIFIRLPEGRFLEVNEVACKRYGYTREELLQMTPMDLDTPDHAARVPRRTEKIIKNGQAVFETVHKTKSGEILYAEISRETRG